jgi:hypothetical protein
LNLFKIPTHEQILAWQKLASIRPKNATKVGDNSMHRELKFGVVGHILRQQSSIHSLKAFEFLPG